MSDEPFAIAAYSVFLGGAALIWVLLVRRHGMTKWGAFLALINVRRVPNRDSLFNGLVWSIIIAVLVLISVAINRSGGQIT